MSAVNQTPHTWSIFIHVYKPFGRSWPLFHTFPQWIQFLLAEDALSISVECFVLNSFHISLKFILLRSHFLFLSLISISTTENTADVVLSKHVYFHISRFRMQLEKNDNDIILTNKHQQRVTM